MHEHRSRQASRGGTKLCKYPWRHSHTKLWKGRLKLAYNSYSVCESKLCPTFRTHHDHMESQRKFLWRQRNTIIASPSTVKLLSLFLQTIHQKICKIIYKKQPSGCGALVLDFNLFFCTYFIQHVNNLICFIHCGLLFIIHNIIGAEIEASVQVTGGKRGNWVYAEMIVVCCCFEKTYIIKQNGNLLLLYSDLCAVQCRDVFFLVNHLFKVAFHGFVCQQQDGPH